MAKTMKGPAIFLAQFAGDEAPFNSLKSIAEWAASLGYKGVQIPSWDGRIFDLAKAGSSKDYCDEVNGICREAGVEITELSTSRDSSSRSIRPMTSPSTPSRRPASTTTRRRGRNGR